MAKSYSALQIFLHWAIAALIIANYLISDEMGRSFYNMMKGNAVSGWTPIWHVWAGVAVLVLALVRLVLRMVSPEEHEPVVTTIDKAGLWGHRALYALMIAVPALGVIAWFGGIAAAADVHVIVMNIMMILVLGHAAMALYHQYIVKDGLLLKMLRPR
jgi:cytochrome b561